MRNIFIIFSLVSMMVVGSCDKGGDDNDSSKDCSYVYSPEVDLENMLAENFDIFIIAGQSNTNTGRVIESEDQKTLSDVYNNSKYRVYQLGRYGGYNNKVIPAWEPLHHHCHRDLMVSVGFARWFAKQYVDEGFLTEGRNVLLVPTGCGGSAFTNGNLACDAKVTIKTWNPITHIIDSNLIRISTLYSDLVERIKKAKSYPGSHLKGIIFWQGGSDILTRYTWTYDGFTDPDDNQIFQPKYDHRINLLKLMQSLKQDFGDEITKIPFLYGGLTPLFMMQNRLSCYHLDLYKLYDQCHGLADTEKFPKDECPFGNKVGFLDPGILREKYIYEAATVPGGPAKVSIKLMSINNPIVHTCSQQLHNDKDELIPVPDPLHFSRKAHKDYLAPKMFKLWKYPILTHEDAVSGKTKREVALQNLAYDCAWGVLEKSDNLGDYNDPNATQEERLQTLRSQMDVEDTHPFHEYEKDYFDNYAKAEN